MYIAAIVWYSVSHIRVASNAADALWSSDYDVHESLAMLQKAEEKQAWMMTISLGVNVSEILPRTSSKA